MRKFVAIAALFVAGSFSVRAQQDGANDFYGRTLSKTATGTLVTYKGAHHMFTFQLNADTVDEMEQDGFYKLNGQIFQVSLVAIPGGQPADTISNATRQALLKSYVEYELAYAKDNGLAFVNVKTIYVTINGHLYIRWSFDQLPPKEKQGISQFAKGQIYYSTIVFDQVVSFNMPRFSAADTFEKCNARIMGVAKTLTLSQGSL